jgi:hypothetical protein
MMASKDNGNKRKYAAYDAKESVEEASPKKQKMISDDNGDDNGDDDNDNDDDNSTSTDDYSSEPKEEVSLEEEEMNHPIGFEEELLIRRGCSDDGDTSADEDESHLFSDDD